MSDSVMKWLPRFFLRRAPFVSLQCLRHSSPRRWRRWKLPCGLTADATVVLTGAERLNFFPFKVKINATIPSLYSDLLHYWSTSQELAVISYLETSSQDAYSRAYFRSLPLAQPPAKPPCQQPAGGAENATLPGFNDISDTRYELSEHPFKFSNSQE